MRGNKNFTSEKITLDKGSVIYLTTDGYSDQNNVAREKIGMLTLRSKLEQIAKLPMAEQGKILEDLLDKHQQGTDQRDDITLIGVRV